MFALMRISRIRSRRRMFEGAAPLSIDATCASGTSARPGSAAAFLYLGNNEFLGFDRRHDLRRSERQIFDVPAVSADEKREPHRYFSCRHGDDEKNEHLRVVIRQPSSTDAKSRESHQRQVGRAFTS